MNVVNVLRSVKRFIAAYLLPAIGLIVLVAILIDVARFDSRLFVQDTLNFARENEVSLSVIISALLLFAYLLQFQSQYFQRKIMSRQETLMNAGYTPILGVTSQEFGQEREVDTNKPEDMNRFYADIVNNGNSTARNLRMWFGISYNGSPLKRPLVRSTEVTLTREQEGTWWPRNIGGALSHSPDSPTTFICDPKVKYKKKIDPQGRQWLTKLFTNPILNPCYEYERVPVHEALEELSSQNIDEFRLALVLRYNTTVGNEDEIPITGYKADPSKIGDNYLLYSSQEHSKEVKKYIKAAN